MTPSEIQSLSPEERRVKCAEFGGFNQGVFEDEWGPLRGFKDETNLTYEVPNYDHDLNACAALEATLTDEEHKRFRAELFKQCRPVADDPMYSVDYENARARLYVSASPSARVTAYLATKLLQMTHAHSL